MDSITQIALGAQGIAYDRIVTLVSPFNTILWRAVAIDEAAYHVGWYSLFDPGKTMEFQHYPTDPGLLDGIEDHWPVPRLQWFTKGFYRVSQIGGDVVITDLRMGIEGSYVFRFKVGEVGHPRSVPVPAELLPSELDTSRLPGLWARLRGVHRYP
ncbi:MAG: hypothetical protein RQ826_03010 [Xanthomonadales bacterium]|nr:hypothetical protein [Xanthomonadales bacterium]